MNKLNKEWETRQKLLKEANTLSKEAGKFLQERYEKTEDSIVVFKDWITVEEYIKYKRMEKLSLETEHIKTIADKFWLNAILENYGNIKMKWKSIKWKTNGYTYYGRNCHLENGETYRVVNEQNTTIEEL